MDGLIELARDVGRDPDVRWHVGHCPVLAGIQLEAMNFFSDTQETALRFGDYIDDLHDVFRCNDVDFGGPEDFFAFARTLKYHSDLRGDVMRVVKSVMESGTNISFREILTVIAVASGGPEVATSEREMSVPVKQVIESLIGVGAYSQLNADHPEGLYSDLTVKGTERAVVPESMSSSGGGEAMEDAEENARVPIPAQDESSFSGEAAGYAGVRGGAGVEEIFFEEPTRDSSLDESPQANCSSGTSSAHQSSLNGLGGSNTLAESLSRLELNSLQLRIYLDSIDQRISRMEPRLEKVAPLVLQASPFHTMEESGARFSAAIAAATIAAETEPELPHSDPPVANQHGSAATAGKVANRSPAVVSSRRRIALPILSGVAMLLVASVLFWRFGRDTDYVVHRVNPAVGEGGNGAVAGVAPNVADSVSLAPVASAGRTPIPTVRDPSVAPVSGASGKSSAPGDTGQSASRPVDKPTSWSKKSAQMPLRSSSDAAATPMMAKDAATVADPSDGAEDLSSVLVSNRPVDVSSGVMAANLVSAPKPSYPALASLTRTQGNVVMEAVISKDGTVEQLHVIKGHRLLRGAAKNAVRNWRYRPYTVDGVPVEVATTVSVDFSLHH
jgi:TonB family protein